jgi:hypothetical protein
MGDALTPNVPTSVSAAPARGLSSEGRPGRKIAWIVLLVLLFLACAVPAYLIPIHTDVGVSLVWAHELLDGKVLYRDTCYENNPPLFVYVAVPAVGLARVTGLAEIPLFNTFVLIWMIIGFLLSWRVLNRTGLLPDAVSRGLFLLAVFVTFGSILHDRMFGQREFLMMLGVVPYLLVTAARAAGRPVPLLLAAGVGLLAGLGLAFKPFFALVPIGVEIYLTFVRRKGWFWRRPELQVIFGFHVVYWALVFILTPGFLNMITISMATYNAYAKPLGHIIRMLLTRFPGPLPFVLFAIVRPSESTRDLRQALLVGVVALMSAVAVQRQGLDYHYYPSSAAAVLLVAAVALGAAENFAAGTRVFRPQGWLPAVLLFAYLAFEIGKWCWGSWRSGGMVYRHHWLALGAAVGLLTAIGAMAWYLPRRGWSRRVQGAAVLTLLVAYLLTLAAAWCYVCYQAERPYRDRELVDLVREKAGGKPAAVLTTGAYMAFPMINYSGATWPLRFGCLGTLPAFYAGTGPKSDGTIYRTRAEMGEVERFTVDCTVEDLLASRPAAIVVDVRPKKTAMGDLPFDFVEYFSRDPRFAEFIKDYAWVRDACGVPVTLSGCRVLERIRR